MKYSQKYPNAEHLQMLDATIMYHKNPGTCANCGMLTNFIDVDFECHVCSEECEEVLINEFFRNAVRR